MMFYSGSPSKDGGGSGKKGSVRALLDFHQKKWLQPLKVRSSVFGHCLFRARVTLWALDERLPGNRQHHSIITVRQSDTL